MRRISFSRHSLERLTERNASRLSALPMVGLTGAGYRDPRYQEPLGESLFDSETQLCDPQVDSNPALSSLFRMSLGPDQVRVPKKPVDYVLAYEDDGSNDRSPESELRRLFCEAMEAEDLEISEERVGKHVFVKVHSPFERLCKAAEAIRVEAALAGQK